MTLVPSLVTATALTAPACPASVRTRLPVLTSKTLIDLSAEPVYDLGPVRQNGHAQDRPLMTGENPHGGRNPHPDGVVGPGRDDRLVVREDRDPRQRRMVVRHSLQLAAARRVPDPDRLIGRAGRDPAGIIGEEDRCDRARVPCQRRERLAVGEVPDPGRLVGRAGDELGAVAAHVHAEHGVAVPREIADGLPLVDVPELGRLVGRGRHDEVAILG